MLCAVLLLLSGAGAWAWSTYKHGTTPANAQQGNPTPVPETVGIVDAPLTVTPQPAASGSPKTLDGYPNMRGVYDGHLVPLDEPYISFQLDIKRQDRGRISGTFTVPEYKDDHLKNATFSGTADTSCKLSITVVGASGDMILYMYGGLNNSSPYTYSLGGTFESCQPGNKATCLPGGDPHAGSWAMERVPTS
jgi:hypothetical protein